MTIFSNTDEAAAFLATGASRETCDDVMRAIVAFANSADEAEQIWEEGLENWSDDNVKAFVDTATRDGRVDLEDLIWGASSGLEIVPVRLRPDYAEDRAAV